MKITGDIYAFTDSNTLMGILNKNPDLKSFADMEIDRMTDEGLIKKSGGCCSGGGCGGGCGCGHKEESMDVSELTTSLMAIFNYYIPDEIKKAINLGGTTFIED